MSQCHWWLWHSLSVSSNLQLHISSYEHQLIIFLLISLIGILLHSTFFSHTSPYQQILICIHIHFLPFFFLQGIKINSSICTDDSTLFCLLIFEVITSLPQAVFLLSTKLFLSPYKTRISHFKYVLELTSTSRDHFIFLVTY